MYLTAVMFTDLQDNNYAYEVGDKYPRDGYTPTAERVKELASSNNKRGVALIKEVKAPKAEVEEPAEEPKPKLKKGGKKASK